MIIYLAVIFLWVLVGIGLTVRHSVRKMISSPQAREEPTAAAEIRASLPGSFQSLLDLEGFRFRKAYSFHASRFGVWIHVSPDPPLRLFYLSRQAASTVYEFITLFSDETSLTTTTTRSAFVFPRPFGSFLQSFPKAKAADLWQRHRQGEEHLLLNGICAKACQSPFLDEFKRSVIRNLSYVTSLRWWFVRGIYWYSVKRFLLHNRPIWKQDLSESYGHWPETERRP
jgi:hypothetical protein